MEVRGEAKPQTDVVNNMCYRTACDCGKFFFIVQYIDMENIYCNTMSSLSVYSEKLLEDGPLGLGWVGGGGG